jgi:phage repressor protein C with HTH and peptisase S24 domain
MEPEIKDGDTVLIDESQKDILAGAVYAVGVDDTIMVKRLEKHPNKLVLHSDNREYAPIYLQGDEINSIRIIGKVIWICRDFR